MSDRDGFEHGVPCLVTGVFPDPRAAAAFYSDLFGWETEHLMPEDHPGTYALCRLRGRDAAAIVSEHGAPAPPEPVWTTLIWVKSTDESAAKATEAGGRVIGQPFDSPGGGRQAVLADPAGAVFSVWEPRQRRGAQVVNEPGAWSMRAEHRRPGGRNAVLLGAVRMGYAQLRDGRGRDHDVHGARLRRRRATAARPPGRRRGDDAAERQRRQPSRMEGRLLGSRRRRRRDKALRRRRRGARPADRTDGRGPSPSRRPRPMGRNADPHAAARSRLGPPMPARTTSKRRRGQDDSQGLRSCAADGCETQTT
jgi:predicted enzyme related to lactoylglutathione lyase